MGIRKRNSKYSPYCFQDMTGQRFFRWLVIRPVEKDRGGQWKWECQCDCGNVRLVRGGDLRCGGSKSCGCYAVKVVSKHIHKDNEYPQRHGQVKNPLYQIWSGMIERCIRSSITNDTICPQWQEFPEVFISEMKELGWKKGLSIFLKEGKSEWSKENVYLAEKGDLYKKHFTKEYSHYRDLIGKKYGHLTVLKNYVTDRAMVDCKCDCGNLHTITADVLVRGFTKTCGCMTGGKWSINFEHCQHCKRNDRPHHSRGICSGCRCSLMKNGLWNNYKPTKKKYKNHK